MSLHIAADPANLPARVPARCCSWSWSCTTGNARLPPPHKERTKDADIVFSLNSGIFGYVNYLVEKDRKYILTTLVNGMPARHQQPLASWLVSR